MSQINDRQPSVFSPFQLQMLELVSRVQDQREMDDIRRLLSDYFARKAEAEIDRLWDDGIIDNTVIEGWKTEHMRTPYKQ